MIHYITTRGMGDAWVGNELRALRQAKIPFVLHAMRDPGDTFFSSEWARQMHRETHNLYPTSAFGVFFSTLSAPFLFGRFFFTAFFNALFGERENIRARIAALAHFFVACHWARGLRRQQVNHIHSQWIHSCGTIGMYAAWLLDKTFSFTGHACDLFRDRVALRDKIARADFIICISTFHRDFFRDNGAKPEQLHVVYCGIDPSRFNTHPSGRPTRSQFHIRASGRLVEKKGLHRLIGACGMLVKRNIDFECTIGGSGPAEDGLRDLIQELGLSDRVFITGKPLTQEDIPVFMHGGDAYCLPCVWAADRDVDGLPQMLMEAMACGLPVVSTRLVGIPDLVIHEQTGLLVEPNDVAALADALERLRTDSNLSNQLAISGRSTCIRSDVPTLCRLRM